jgi:predicted porin
MKKTWIALAVAGAFVGAAHAQSSVTLYGIADVNVQLIDPKVSGVKSTTGVNSGHQSGSRWGFRGSEDLGGGLKAVFTLENGFSVDTGTIGQGGRLFGRQAWVGLEGGFGTVALGRFAALGSGTGSFDMFGFTDPFLTGFGGANLIFSIANAFRYDNGILWRSQKMGGFQVGLEHSRNINGGEVAGNSNNTYMTGGAAGFEAGPFRGAVTYNVFNNPAAGASDQKNLQVGATFDLGIAKLHAGYANEKDQFTGNAVGITNGADANAYMVGATVKVGAGSVLASYQNYNGKAHLGQERDLRRFGLGYTHPLSRRTNLYFSFADNDGKKTLNNNPSFDFRQYTAGVRHLF